MLRLKVIYYEPQNIEVFNIVLKTSAVRNSLFDIRYSKCKTGKSYCQKGEGFTPIGWKN